MKNTMHIVSCIGLLTAVALVRSARAASTTIDFETFPDPQPTEQRRLNVQYAPVSVIFHYTQSNFFPERVTQAESLDFPAPRPGGTHFALGPDFGKEHQDSDLVIEFASKQSVVQLYGGTQPGCATATGTLVAFDTSGNQVGQDVHPLNLGSISAFFSITTPIAKIARVSFHATDGNGACLEAIDDLHIEGDPPPLPGPPPVVDLSAPAADAQEYTASDLNAAGTFQSQNLFPQIQIDLTSFDNQSGIPSTDTFLLNVFSSTSTTPFSLLLRAAGTLPLGSYKVVATVRDYWGQQTQGSVEFMNVPAGQVTDPNLGAFQFAVPAGSCQMAFYANGAIAYFSQNTSAPTFVPTPIANKWLTVTSPIVGTNQTLGCPASGDFTVPTAFAAGTWDVQDFERGTIYAPSSGKAVYSPKVLTQVMQSLAHPPPGGTQPESAIVGTEFALLGWPVADPEYLLDADDPVWVFQRFAENDLGPAYLNTIEIRGRAPRLYIERIGGDMLDSVKAYEDGQGGFPPSIVDSKTPTQWIQMPCTMVAPDKWPSSCDMTTYDQPDQNGLYLSLNDPNVLDGGPFCGSPSGCTCGVNCNTFGGIGNNPPSWKDVDQDTNFVLDQYSGIIRALDEVGPNPGSHLANEDYFYVHDNCNSTFGDVAGEVGSALFTGLVACAGAVTTTGAVGEGEVGVATCLEGASWTKDVVGRSCRSDWNLHTRPLPTRHNWGFLSAGNIVSHQDFEIEFEAVYASNYYRGFTPQAGDLVTVHGRHIIDCAHCDPVSFKAEMHPPDTVAVSRSYVSQPFANLDAIRTTDAYIWANGFFPGIISVGISAFAPPRPFPAAKLKVCNHESGYYRLHKLQESPVVAISFGAQMSLATGNSFDSRPGATTEGEWIQRDDPTEFVDNWHLFWSLLPGDTTSLNCENN